MKYFVFRYTKLLFAVLRLDVIFNWLSGLFLNGYYLTKFSLWISKNRKIGYNDFPSMYDYQKRYPFYKWTIEQEKLADIPINYMEFGVAQGTSFRWFLQQNLNIQSRFHGFDTFTGLPEDFGPYKKGTFNNGSMPPDVSDDRAKFYQGLFQQTVPEFLRGWTNDKRNIVMLDADIYSATMYVLTCLAPYLKKDDIIFFDEFSVPTHEFKAYSDFVQSFYIPLELIAAANNYYFVAFRIP
jgi:O-methyltransferase